MSLHTDCVSTCQAIDAQREGRNYEQEKTDASRNVLKCLLENAAKHSKLQQKSIEAMENGAYDDGWKKLRQTQTGRDA